MIKKHQTRTPLAWLFLLTFLFTWVKSTVGLPVLLVMMGDSHEVFFTYKHGAIHLVFHHPGNQHKHDLAVADRSEDDHDLPANALAHFTSRQERHPDHEIHLSDFKQEAGATTKTVEVSNSVLHLPTSQIPPVFAEPASVGFLPQCPPEINPTLVCLRTTVLQT